MRLVRGIGALVLLAGILVGGPFLLREFGTLPSIGTQWDWSVLLRPDDGSVLLGLLTVLGWGAWAVFSVAFLAELVASLSRQRIRISLPGLRRPQAIMAGLLLAVSTMLALPLSGGADPGAPPPVVRTVTLDERGAIRDRPPTLEVGPAESATAPDSTPQQSGYQHRVTPTDDLWTLAERFYGDGRRWTVIAEANPELDPHRLPTGAQLSIPDYRPSVPPPLPPEPTLPPEPAPTPPTRGAVESAGKLPQSAETGRPAPGVPRAETPSAVPPTLPAETDPVPPVPSAPVPSTPTAPAETPGTAAPTRPAPPTTTSVTSTGPVTPATPGAPVTGNTDAPPALPAADPEPESERRGMFAGGIGCLLAAGFVGAIAQRREIQLVQRPVGRRIPHPAGATRRTAERLGGHADTAALDLVDHAQQLLGAHFRRTEQPVPDLSRVEVTHESARFCFAADPGLAPWPFHQPVAGTWELPRAARGHGVTRPPIQDEAPGAGPVPWPALVTVGAVGDSLVLVDLESLGRLHVGGPRANTMGAINALMLELACSWWNGGLPVELVGGDPAMVSALNLPNVRHTAALDPVLAELEAIAGMRRAGARQHRLSDELAEAWLPRVLIVDTEITEQQRRRLAALPVGPEPGIAIVSATDLGGPRLHLDPDTETGRLQTRSGITELLPQVIDQETRDAIVALLRISESRRTDPAPWWDPGPAAPVEHAPPAFAAEGDPRPASAITTVLRPPPDPPGGPPEPAPGLPLDAALPEQSGPEQSGPEQPNPQQSSNVAYLSTHRRPQEPVVTTTQPIVMLLGPMDLRNARGPRPARAARACVEYAAWLLDHPGSTSVRMCQALQVAEGTRRSNMSRLRTWLGVSADGEPFLPDAYGGRIELHEDVTSDWQLVQLYLTGGVRGAQEHALVAVLELIRGEPLADGAPAQWLWAEVLRTDMASTIRDVGLTLGLRASERGDLDLARWALNRALIAVPEDEQLLCVRLAIEYRAGNHEEIERLCLRLSRNARRLNVDLADETVRLMQQAMDGRVRVRTIS